MKLLAVGCILSLGLTFAAFNARCDSEAYPGEPGANMLDEPCVEAPGSTSSATPSTSSGLCPTVFEPNGGAGGSGGGSGGYIDPCGVAAVNSQNAFVGAFDSCP